MSISNPLDPQDPTDLGSPGAEQLVSAPPPAGIARAFSVTVQSSPPVTFRVRYDDRDGAYRARGPDFATTGIEIRSTNKDRLVERLAAYVAARR